MTATLFRASDSYVTSVGPVRIGSGSDVLWFSLKDLAKHLENANDCFAGRPPGEGHDK